MHPAHVGVVPFLALRLQEALADVVIGAGALQILRAARRMAFGNALAAAVLDGARLARPFAEPGVVVTDDFLEPQPDRLTSPISAPPQGAMFSPISSPCDQR